MKSRLSSFDEKHAFLFCDYRVHGYIGFSDKSHQMLVLNQLNDLSEAMTVKQCQKTLLFTAGQRIPHKVHSNV